MSVLYLTTLDEDYLQDTLLLGLRSILGEELMDFPKKEVLYKTCARSSNEIYGLGFTVYKTLDEIDIDRSSIDQALKTCDVVVFASVWRQRKLFLRLLPKLILRRKTITFLDGEDFNKIVYWTLPFGKYFKRERRRKVVSFFTKPISFSIPENKIKFGGIKKVKAFAKHNQCEESYKLEEVKNYCQPKYSFDREEDYYNDIATSKYGFTKRKGGWDCLRHYEITANGTVPLFFEFDKKPSTCAPHGLKDMENILSFNSAEELEVKLKRVEEEGLYSQIQTKAAEWAKTYSSESVARRFLDSLSIQF